VKIGTGAYFPLCTVRRHKETIINWEAIGAIGEILAATTVIATLVYLSLQVKSVKEQTSVSAHQHLYDSMNEFVKLISESDSLSSIIVKGRASYSSLSELKSGAKLLPLHALWCKQT
jgi:hypothetical protein